MSDGDDPDFWSTAPAEGCSVCADCIDDVDIRAFIASRADELACDFCDRSSTEQPVAAPLESVVEFMMEAIDREYDRAVNALGWESAEGGFQGSHWDSYDLLTEQIDIALSNDDGRLLDILVECLGDNDWCERNPYGLREDERYIASWDEFSNFIKYQRRYFFLESQRPEGELLSPPSLLEFISETVVDYRLLTTIPTGSIVYRARQLRPGRTLRSSRTAASGTSDSVEPDEPGRHRDVLWKQRNGHCGGGDR
jgi:hypothetical protein